MSYEYIYMYSFPPWPSTIENLLCFATFISPIFSVLFSFLTLQFQLLLLLSAHHYHLLQFIYSIPTLIFILFEFPYIRYYALEVSYFKSSLDRCLLESLWHKYWINTLSTSLLSAVLRAQLAFMNLKATIRPNMFSHRTQITQPVRCGT